LQVLLLFYANGFLVVLILAAAAAVEEIMKYGSRFLREQTSKLLVPPTRVSHSPRPSFLPSACQPPALMANYARI
jgi:hypothetical protein